MNSINFSNEILIRCDNNLEAVTTFQTPWRWTHFLNNCCTLINQSSLLSVTSLKNTINFLSSSSPVTLSQHET
ncbi:hypothetical protein L1887_17041 [Cichorium endivia]|nr:hypothetical protein L1887_17041 [Cichorium endivia]